ncbi:hypothetical protein DP806_16395 [Salmonella enterica subsp. enterica serovar Saintpaul]|nr:hypothetical protein [Salmonella enterica subsp. enterica serovar Saintpaul]
MKFSLKGFSLSEYTIIDIRGNTLWLSGDEPFSVSSYIAERTRIGHQIRLLMDSKKRVYRLKNLTTGYIYSIRHEKESANKSAIGVTCFCGIPLIGAAIGGFLVVPALIIFALGRGGEGAIRMILTVLITALAYVAIGLFGILEMDSFLVAIVGPIIVTFIGSKYIFNIESAFAEQLTEAVRTNQI